MSDRSPSAAEMKIVTADEFPQYIQTQRSVPKYDSRCEQKAPHPYWNLPRVCIDTGLNDLHEKLAYTLKGAPKGDRELEHLVKTIHTISQVKRSPDTIFGLVGEQGFGKSMFLKALFDREGISWSGAEGEACTSTVVKYAQLYASSTSANTYPFCAEVKFLDAKKIEEMIREQVRYFKHYHQDPEDSDDEEPREAQSFEQDGIDKDLRDTAYKILKVLIGSEKELQGNLVSMRTEEFVQLCQMKCLQAIRKYEVDDHNVFRECGNTPHELMSKIKHFLADLKGLDCLWPLVDHVTIRFDHPLLKHGAIVIDVPGSGDTNISRARHIEDIKDTADIVLIFVDTVRIATNKTAIKTAERCIVNRGIGNVKLVATKIDALLPNDLKNCQGDIYDKIRNLIQAARDDERVAEDAGDDVKVVQTGQYITYLERCLLQYFVTERSTRLSNVLSEQLKGPNPSQILQIFHISASNYLDWQTRPMISFRDQPPLPVACTGIPEIRQYLFSILAPKNLSDVVCHLNICLPNYLEKIKRVINESDRDADFASLAQEFDQQMGELMKDLLSQTKQLFHKILKDTLAKICNDTTVYKRQVDDKLHEEMCKLRSPFTFTKIMKFRGNLPPKVSKARGLENGCSYNRDFSNILAPAFLKWAATYKYRMQYMRQSLIQLTGLIARAVLLLLDTSSANIMVVERAKKTWKPFRTRLVVKMKLLMDGFEELHRRTMIRATMEDGRSNCLVAAITDKHFDAVLEAEFPEKSISTSKKKKGYESKGKFQKRILMERLSSPNCHFVDDVFKLFQEECSKNNNTLLERHFQQIRELLDQYSTSLKAEAPISYKVEKIGINIREELEQELPDIEKKIEALQKELPNSAKTEDDRATYLPDMENASTLSEIYTQLSRKRKKSTADTAKVTVKKEKR